MRLVTLSFLFISISALYAQNLPLGYITHFESDFSGNLLHKDLLFSPSSDLKLANGVLYMQQNIDTVPLFKPAAAMLINNNIFGDFISELSIIEKSTLADSTSGIYLIFGLRNKENYYMVQINSSGTGFYKMYKGIVDKISFDSSLVLSHNKAVKIHIERNILERSITIKLQGKQTVFTDPNLVMGYFGLGSNSSKIGIDKMTIWAPTSLVEPLSIF